VNTSSSGFNPTPSDNPATCWSAYSYLSSTSILNSLLRRSIFEASSWMNCIKSKVLEAGDVADCHDLTCVLAGRLAGG
jgi:hypothetical protein